MHFSFCENCFVVHIFFSFTLTLEYTFICCYLIQDGLLDMHYTELSHVELIICMAAHPFMFLLHEEHKNSPHCKCLQGITGTLQGKSAISMEKGCKNQKETLCILWVNPVISTDCGETP